MAATKLRFSQQPTGYTSEGVLTTQPIVQAVDDSDVVDTTFTGVVTLTPSAGSSRFTTTTPTLSSSHSVQAGSDADTLLVSPALSFPTSLPPDYTGMEHYAYISSVLGSTWTTATAYNVGDYALRADDPRKSYRCILAHTSDATNQPPNATYWVLDAIKYERRLITSNTGTGQLNLSAVLSAVPSVGVGINVRSHTALPKVAVTCVSGVATFSGLSLMGWESCALVASSPGLTSATSNAMTPTGTRDGSAELPLVTVDTSVPVTNGVVKYVGPTGDYPATAAGLQQAMDDRVNANSNMNDVIVLQAGVDITGNFIRRKKLSGTGYITIKGHSDPAPENTRVQMSTFVGGSYAKVRSFNAGPAFYNAPGAHHWRLQGFEVLPDGTVDSNGLINHTDSQSENDGTGTLANMPDFMFIDRMFVHGGEGTKNCKYGVKLNCKTAGVVDSYIAPIIDRNNDCQSIVDFAGAGPYRIHNNYCEASSENIIFGGADPYVVGAVSSDVTITNNYLYKPLAWKTDGPVNDKVKNIFEIKSARRCLVEGNVMEFNWPSGQAGDSVLFTPVNQSGTAANAGLRDVTFRYNVIRNVASGYQITEENSEAGVRSFGFWRVSLHDNVMWNINDPVESNGSGNHRCYSLFDGCYDASIRHNTTLGSPNATSADTRTMVFNDPNRPAARSKFDDNLTTAQGYAFIASGDTPGGPSINHCLLSAGGTCNNNALVDFQPVYGGTGYPASTLFPAALANVGVANSGITSTWDSAPIDTVLAALTITTAGAPDLRTAASDGTAVGANMAAVRAAVTGVVEGTPGTGGGTPTQLLLSQQPAGAVSGQPLTQQPVVRVADVGGSTVTSDTSTVTVTLNVLTGSGVLTNGTKAAVAGLAAFTALTITGSGTGTITFTDGSLTSVTSASFAWGSGLPASATVLPTIVDQWRPTQRNREGLEVVPSASPLIGTGGTTVQNSATTAVLIPVGRVKVSVLSLSLDAMTAAGSSGTVTVQVFKVSGGNSTALTTAQSIKSDVISASGNVVLPVLTSLFDGASNGMRRIDGTRGDTLRVDVVAAGTITTQPVVRVVAELAVNS